MKINTSVIISTYNEQEHIVSCVRSLLNQTLKQFEIIVVDDGSTDNTLKSLDAIETKEIPLVVLQQSHQGAGVARNNGAKKAKGFIYVFVDADMTFDQSFLENLIAPINKGRHIGTFSKEEFVSNWDNIWARAWSWNQHLPDRARLPKHYPDEQKVFRAILAEAFHTVHGFSRGGYTDDWSLSQKLQILAHNAPGAVLYHANPDTLREVFVQSKWVAKRKYKFGFLGLVFSLFRASLPVSLVLGVFYSVVHVDLRFLLFKIVYDFGTVMGILSYMLFKNGKK